MKEQTLDEERKARLTSVHNQLSNETIAAAKNYLASFSPGTTVQELRAELHEQANRRVSQMREQIGILERMKRDAD